MNALKLPNFVVYFSANTVTARNMGTESRVGMARLANGVNILDKCCLIVADGPVGLGPFIAVYAESWDARRAMLMTKITMAVISMFILSFSFWDCTACFLSWSVQQSLAC